MQASDWIGRMLCLVITFGIAFAKNQLFQPEALLLEVGINQCISALCNATAVIAAAYFVRGPASYDLQLLAFCAVIVNFLSFIAFAAKNSPMVFFLNQTIMVISYVQFVRLLWPSNGSPLDYRSSGVFLRFADLSASGFHSKKEKS